MHEYAEILKYKSTDQGTMLVVMVPDKDLGDYLRRFAKDGKVSTELRIDDPRYISNEQRKKARALIGDIALHTGFEANFLHDLMKLYYCIHSGEDEFSLSNCSMTTARHYISYLIEFCFEWDIPLADSGLDRTDDIGKYLWLCIKFKKCSLCGKPADVHHVQAIGMGMDRKTYDDINHEKIALCREHHTIAHQTGWDTFSKKYKVYGVRYVNTKEL